MQFHDSLISNSWDKFCSLLTKRWQTFVWYVVGYFLLQIVTLIALALIAYPVVMDVIENLQVLITGQLSLWDYWVYGAVALVVALITFLIQQLLMYGMLRLAPDTAAGQSLGTLVSHGKDQYWRTFGRLFLFFLVLTLVLFAVGVAYNFAITGLLHGGSELVPLILGIVLALAGVYFSVYIMTIFYHIIMGKESVGASVRAASAMIKHRWWRTFGTVLFWMVVTIVTMLVFTFVTGLIFAALMPEMGTLDEAMMNVMVSGGGPEQIQEAVMAYLGSMLTVSFIGLTLLQMVLQALIAIVPTYGMLALYLTLRDSASGAPSKE